MYQDNLQVEKGFVEMLVELWYIVALHQRWI